MNQDPLRDLWRTESLRTQPRLYELATLLILSERQAPDSEMPAGKRRGWWADPTYGSLLWIYSQGGRLAGATTDAVRAALADALQPLVDDGTAQSVATEAERTDVSEIRAAATVTENDGSEVRVTYPQLWDALRGVA